MSPRKLLAIILTVGLTARIYIAFFYTNSWYFSDSYVYISQAEKLLEGEYSSYFPNGYPLIISSFLFITGSINSAEVLLILLNIVLSTLVILLVYKISLTLYGKENIALLAALLTALYPNQINYVRFILSDIPAVFLLVLSLYFLQNSKYKLSAIAAGLASVTRTVLLPIGILFSFYLFKKKNNREGRAYLINFLVPACLFLLYGFIINGEITLGKNMFHNFLLTAQDYEGDYIDIESSLNSYISYLHNNPLKYIRDRFISLWELWGPFPSITKWEKPSMHYRLLAGFRFPLLLFALYSFFLLPVSREKIFIATALITLTAVHFFFFSNSRHSLTLEPLLIVLAVKGLEQIYKMKQGFVSRMKKISENNSSGRGSGKNSNQIIS